MNKRVRNLIICLVVLCVIGGALFLLLKLGGGESENPSSASSASNAIKLVNKKQSAAELIKVKNETGEYEIKKTEDSWTIEEYSALPLNTSFLTQYATAVTYTTADQVIEENAEDLAKFGLDKPQAVIQTTYNDDNSTFTLEIGDKAPLEAGYYVKTGDSNKVYTCKSSEIPNLFLAKKTKAIQSELVPANGSEDSSDSAATFVLDKLVLGGSARTEAITIEQINDLTESGASASYAVVAPRKADLNVEKGGELLKAVFGIEADDIEVANATAEDYKKYGLDDPYCVLTLEYAGETVTLKITDDSDGYCYVVKNDIPVIYKVAKDKVSFRSVQYKDIASRLIFSATITDVKTVTVDTPDQSYVFELKHKGDDIEISYEGKVLDTAKFKKFYQVLIGARIEKEEPADKTGDVVLRFTYAYHDESKANDVLEFHKLSDRKALAVLNGKSFGFDVLMTYVQKVYEDCEKVINNELVATDW